MGDGQPNKLDRRGSRRHDLPSKWLTAQLWGCNTWSDQEKTAVHAHEPSRTTSWKASCENCKMASKNVLNWEMKNPYSLTLGYGNRRCMFVTWPTTLSCKHALPAGKHLWWWVKQKSDSKVCGKLKSIILQCWASPTGYATARGHWNQIYA